MLFRGGGTYVVALNIDLWETHELIAFLISITVMSEGEIPPERGRFAGWLGAGAAAKRTGLVWTTSLRVRFIHVSHMTRCPFRVSPFLSSTSMGWPWAALSNPRGSFGWVRWLALWELDEAERDEGVP